MDIGCCKTDCIYQAYVLPARKIIYNGYPVCALIRDRCFLVCSCLTQIHCIMPDFNLVTVYYEYLTLKSSLLRSMEFLLHKLIMNRPCVWLSFIFHTVMSQLFTIIPVHVVHVYLTMKKTCGCFQFVIQLCHN